MNPYHSLGSKENYPQKLFVNLPPKKIEEPKIRSTNSCGSIKRPAGSKVEVRKWPVRHQAAFRLDVEADFCRFFLYEN